MFFLEIPTSEERKRSAYRQKIEECMNRAEKLKDLIKQQQKSSLNISFSFQRSFFFQAKNLHEQIQIKDNSIGNSYEKLFSRFFDGTVSEIIVEDPYIRAFHQVRTTDNNDQNGSTFSLSSLDL